jgi:predicted dehydrogenase
MKKTRTGVDNKPSIILIGCGPHSKRVYLPALLKSDKVNLKLIVDLKGQEDRIRKETYSLTETDYLFVDPFSGNLPEALKSNLTEFTIENEITGVIIATEPLVHFAYATWALDQHLNILMDKPISTRVNVSSNIEEAKGLVTDYLELLEKYEHSQTKKDSIFIINSQRRFHKGFDFVKSKIHEVATKTNCPVTFISAYHSDGQWRLPNEIVTQEYHPYCYGYGKASHSGYHIFDTVQQIYEASQLQDKMADNFQVTSSFVTPAGFIKQLTETDYFSIFGGSYSEVNEHSDEELKSLYQNFGELDISAILKMNKQGSCVANCSINLLHNSFAGRTWLYPASDLYKGNGRIKHEYYNIQQGPFQNIQIHSYQSEDIHDNSKGDQFNIGENNHFDVYIFRNPLVSSNGKRMELFSYRDILKDSTSYDANIVMEDVKHTIVNDFIDFLRFKKTKKEIKSQIIEHLVPVQIMSAIYQSHILEQTVRTQYGMTSTVEFQ